MTEQSNYMLKRAAILEEELNQELPEVLFSCYLSLACTSASTGTPITNEEIHDAWSIWKNTVDSSHVSIIPYNQLSIEIQELDAPYTDAVNRAADRIKNWKNNVK